MPPVSWMSCGAESWAETVKNVLPSMLIIKRAITKKPMFFLLIMLSWGKDMVENYLILPNWERLDKKQVENIWINKY
jgi:hypothetical protein